MLQKKKIHKINTRLLNQVARCELVKEPYPPKIKENQKGRPGTLASSGGGYFTRASTSANSLSQAKANRLPLTMLAKTSPPN